MVVELVPNPILLKWSAPGTVITTFNEDKLVHNLRLMIRYTRSINDGLRIAILLVVDMSLIQPGPPWQATFPCLHPSNLP
jgi:hypothetical protein